MRPGLQWLLGAAALVALVWGINAYQGQLIARGDAQGAARVQAAWDAETYQRNLAIGQANAVRQRAAEKVADEHAQRQAITEKRAALAAAAVRRLRTAIERLNERDRPFTADASGIAACTCEATTARELLGTCSNRYTVLGADADALRDQVIGLQAWIARTCVPTGERP